jgi:Multiubiquitin
MAEPTDIRRPKTVSFTIDGRPYVTDDENQPARDLLRLAGLDPSGYDLAEIRNNAKPKKFQDDEIVHIKDGARFISIRQRAEVA